MQNERRLLPARRNAVKMRLARRGRGNMLRLALGVAALSGPVAWAGHALLLWAHVL